MLQVIAHHQLCTSSNDNRFVSPLSLSPYSAIVYDYLDSIFAGHTLHRGKKKKQTKKYTF